VTSPALDTPSTDDHGFFGQPRALASIFGVEMWVRFSFYGMQGILTIYLSSSARRCSRPTSRSSA
jgi:POT family proton-dependent oligopeptide transporter